MEYSYDTEYAKYLFDEVNKMRTANGVEPFVWNEEDAVYASKVKVECMCNLILTFTELQV